MVEEDKGFSLKTELFMFYNVENLFLPDPPSIHKLDPTPSGLRNWNQRRYQHKIEKLAKVFQLVKEEKGVLPLFIGLAEVASEKCLQDLLAHNDLAHKYGIVHYDSLDERGVDTALLYDRSKVKILESEAISFVFEKDYPSHEPFDTTRDVLYCKLNYNEEVIHVFVLHLPSKREKDINKPKRDFILKSLKERILSQFADETVVVCGDFNENPTSEMIVQWAQNDEEKEWLKNPFVELFLRKRYSTYHHKDGLLFDQMLLSPNFFGSDAFLVFQEACVFSPEVIKNKDKRFHGRPFRTYSGSRYLGGYSDHFPVLIELKKNK